MHRRSFFLSTVIFVFIGLLFGTFAASSQEKRGRKYKAPPPTARIEVTVLNADDGKPIENAAVIFHMLKEEGSMELKSNEDGKAVIDVLPIGETARLQVIGKGFQTFGQDYPIEKKDMAIEVRLKRPGQQYSIYKNHPGDKQDKSKDQNKDKPQ